MSTQTTRQSLSILVALAFCMALQMTGFAIFLPLLVGKEKTMNTNRASPSEKTFACETCPTRKKAEANPKTLMARLWRWHTGWCPGSWMGKE